MMRLEVAIVLGLCLGVANTQKTLDAASHDKIVGPTLTALGGDTGDTMDGSQPGSCDQGISGRKGIYPPYSYWPGGVLPFEFHESIENDVAYREKKPQIYKAMAHWSNHTCISFRPRQSTDRSFLIFRSDKDECSSYMGIVTWNSTGQNFNLGVNCWHVEIIAHEIGHAIGFFHEHQRMDRDQHVKIIWTSVNDTGTGDFCREHDFNRSVPYDLTSIMHYNQWAASIDGLNKSTIVTKDPLLQLLLHKRNLLSFRDRRLANLMYYCTDETSDACRNGGYLRKTAHGKHAGKYTCDCPPNTEGEFCEIKTRDSYYEKLSCGGNVTREGVIETSGDPERTQDRIGCAWQILAPTDHRVKLTIENFKFSPRINELGSKFNNKCKNDIVELRLDASKEDLFYQGSFHCGNDLKRGQVLESNGNRAVIIVNAGAGSNLKARVSFVPIING